MSGINYNHVGSPQKVYSLSFPLMLFLIRTKPELPTSCVEKFQISHLTHHMYFVVPKKIK